MDNIKNDFYYIKRILRSIEVTMQYLKNKDMDTLLYDGYLQDALENRFTKIAEDVTKLSSEFKKTYADIPWSAIVSIRNRICHDYDVVDAPILYKTVKINFPEFREKLLRSITYYHMILNCDSFELIQSGNKNIEIRLFDKEIENIKIGDIILFDNQNTKDNIIVEVIDLKCFKTFEELFAHFDKKMLGYNSSETISLKDLAKHFKANLVQKYGIAAIEIKKY